MKTTLKFSCTAMVLLVCVFAFCTCSLTYTSTTVNNVDIGYSKTENRAFIAHICCKPGDDTTIVLPDYYEGIPITDLGGYIGRGYPMPFSVDVDFLGADYEKYSDCYCTDEKYLHDEDLDWWDDCVIHNVYLQITLPKYLKSITYVSYDVFVGEIVNGDGSVSAEIFRPICCFTIDADNRYFYSKDGKIYDKNTNETVLDFGAQP